MDDFFVAQIQVIFAVLQGLVDVQIGHFAVGFGHDCSARAHFSAQGRAGEGNECALYFHAHGFFRHRHGIFYGHSGQIRIYDIAVPEAQSGGLSNADNLRIFFSL